MGILLNMNKIDILVVKTDSFDTDSIIEDIVSYSSKSIILVLDYDRKIRFQYKPANIELRHDRINLVKFKNPKLNVYFFPLLFIFELVIFTKILLIICLKYRPKICLIEIVYPALIMVFLKKFNLCGKVIYMSTDWFVNKSNKKSVISYLGNSLFFPFADYLACKFSDLVLNPTEKITEARYKFWGRKIAKKERLYLYKMQVKVNVTDMDQKNKNISFVGIARKDSGLDIVIKSLFEIRRKDDISLKIIGHRSLHCKYLEKISREYNIKEDVKFLGFVERNKLGEMLSDCFCGVNLLTDFNSFSIYTIPGKIITYLQFLLPVIATEGIGPIASVIKNNKLGLIIKPSYDAFIDAVIEIYRNQGEYRKNIISYINSLPKRNIIELLGI